MKFILQARLSMAGDTLDLPDGYDCCVVDIGVAYAKLILSRMDALGGILRAYEIYFWDYNASWHAMDQDLVEPTEIGEASATECDQLIVRKDDICWTTIPKHTGLYIMSDEIKRETIEAIAAGREAPA